MSPPFEFLCFDLIFVFNDQEFLKTIKLDMFLFFHRKIKNTKGSPLASFIQKAYGHTMYVLCAGRLS